MMKIRITNSNDYITDNFQKKEFRNCKYGGYKDFDCPEGLINGVQTIRDFFKVPIKITSVLRTADKFGFHRTGEALDCVAFEEPLKYIKIFRDECEKYKITGKSQLIEALRSVGVSGFGIESGCIHIDCRESIFNSKDSYGRYCMFYWENSK